MQRRKKAYDTILYKVQASTAETAPWVTLSIFLEDKPWWDAAVEENWGKLFLLEGQEATQNF